MQRSTPRSPCSERIAIVGIGCRLPGGVDSAESLWEFLCRRGDGVRDIPADRWNIDAVYDPQPGNAWKVDIATGRVTRQCRFF